MAEDRKKPTSYVCTLTAEQAAQLGVILREHNWEMREAPYAFWQARLDKTTVTAYHSGKLTAQGRGVEDLVIYILEPEILKQASFGYEELLAPAAPEESFFPHGGVDESGKGDFFGPLVICACYVDEHSKDKLAALGVKDSKAIKSDRKIREMASGIRRITGGSFAIVRIGNEAYNKIYEKIGNLNRLLAWGHARAIEDLLDKVPQCGRLLADKFGNESLIKNALMKNGRNAVLEQRTKAESDIAVAAASILARDVFVREMEKLGQQLGMAILPKGAGAKVEQTALELVSEHGTEILRRYAKLHFRTAAKVLESFNP